MLKFARTSKLRIEITSLNKKMDERKKLLGNKVIELIASGELEAEMFEPDYSYIKNIENEIQEKEEQIDMEAQEPEEENDSEEEKDGMGLVNIESQKVLTADSIPVEEQTGEKKDQNKDYSI